MNETNSTQRVRLYLIRHGEVEGATAGKLLGLTDSPLSARGLEQSHELAEALTNAQLSVIYSSDLQRARMTAEIIAKRSKWNVQQDSTWREINMGQWEGRTIELVHREAPELVAQLFDDPASFEYPGGESFAAFTVRIQKALEHLLWTHQGDEVVLVTHGGVCRAIIGSALGIPPRNWLRLGQDYGCMNVIDWYDENPMLQLLNQRTFVLASYGL
ncbi:MAG: histidine phosphatase family protein [Acidobacteriales bacterium]|nr:histidine phosphatase family protein [Terriglobales bacterium]